MSVRLGCSLGQFFFGRCSRPPLLSSASQPWALWCARLLGFAILARQPPGRLLAIVPTTLIHHVARMSSRTERRLGAVAVASLVSAESKLCIFVRSWLVYSGGAYDLYTVPLRRLCAAIWCEALAVARCIARLTKEIIADLKALAYRRAPRPLIDSRTKFAAS